MSERWSTRIDEDLVPLSREAGLELINVANTSLDHHFPPDGHSSPPYFARRGIRHAARPPLSAAQEEAREYVIIYKRSRILSDDYLILAIVQNRDLADALGKYLGLY